MATTTTDPQLYPGWTNQGQTGDNESSGTAATAGLSGLTSSNKDPQFVTGWTNQSGTGDNEKGAGPDSATLTQPAVPATGVAYVNSTGLPVHVYLTGVTSATTNVTITSPGGTAYILYASVAAATTVDLSIPMGWSVKMTYTNAPTWIWTPGI